MFLCGTFNKACTWCKKSVIAVIEICNVNDEVKAKNASRKKKR